MIVYWHRSFAMLMVRAFNHWLLTLEHDDVINFDWLLIFDQADIMKYDWLLALDHDDIINVDWLLTLDQADIINYDWLLTFDHADIIRSISYGQRQGLFILFDQVHHHGLLQRCYPATNHRLTTSSQIQ